MSTTDGGHLGDTGTRGSGMDVSVRHDVLTELEQRLGAPFLSPLRESLLTAGANGGGRLAFMTWEQIARTTESLRRKKFSSGYAAVYALRQPGEVVCFPLNRRDSGEVAPFILAADLDKGQPTRIIATSAREALLQRALDVHDDEVFARGLFQLALRGIDVQERLLGVRERFLAPSPGDHIGTASRT